MKKTFTKVNEEVKRVAELTNFKRDRKLRITGDASEEELGAALQQIEQNFCKPIAYASRFLTEFEKNTP